MIADLVRTWVPFAWEAFEAYRLGAAILPREEIALVRRIIAGASLDALLPTSGLSMRERKDLRAVLRIPKLE